MTLIPADRKAVAVALDRLWDWAAAFGLGNGSPEAASRHYAAALSDLPPDLLMLAVDRVIRDHKWGGRLPLPADLRNAVSGELARRKLTLSRLDMAASRPHERVYDGPRDLSAEQQAKLEEIKGSLGGGSTRGKPSPVEEADRKPRRIVTTPLPSEDDPKVREILKSMGGAA